MDPYLLASPRMRCLVNRSLLQDRHITLRNSNLGEPTSQVQLTNSLFKFHSISPEPSPISLCLPQAAEQMPFSLLDCIEPCSRCSGILLRWRPPSPPSLGGGGIFQKKKKRDQKKNIYIYAHPGGRDICTLPHSHSDLYGDKEH